MSNGGLLRVMEQFHSIQGEGSSCGPQCRLPAPGRMQCGVPLV